MPSQTFPDALNEQIANEFAAHQQYIAAAVYYDAETLPRLAAFFYRQAIEEREHAMIMIRYLLDTDEEVRIPDIKSQQTSYMDGVNPVKMALEQEPPYGARVHFEVESAMGGWNAPRLAPWLEQSMQRASRDFFGKDSMFMGTGGSIPFMGMLGERFPQTQFLVTGVLGPNSNAHGPNEFLHIDTARKLTACVAQVLADHAQQAAQRRAA